MHSVHAHLTIDINSGMDLFVSIFLMTGDDTSARNMLPDRAPTVMTNLIVLRGCRQVTVYDPRYTFDVVVINPLNRSSPNFMDVIQSHAG